MKLKADSYFSQKKFLAISKFRTIPECTESQENVSDYVDQADIDAEDYAEHIEPVTNYKIKLIIKK